MNKRQAKKEFKKKYGCNLDEFCCTLDICLKNMSKVCDEICEAMPKILEDIAESLNTLNQFLATDGFYHIVQALSEMELETKNKEEENEIRINEDMSENQKKETLCHEMVHGILIHLGFDDLSNNEQFVQALGNAIYQGFEVKENKE